MQKKEILEKVLKVLEDKKALDVNYIETNENDVLADYYVVATGTSNTHIKSLTDNIEQELKKDKIYPNTIEGYESNSWILIDYGSVLIHIFTQNQREYYNIEELWERFKKTM